MHSKGDLQGRAARGSVLPHRQDAQARDTCTTITITSPPIPILHMTTNHPNHPNHPSPSCP